MESLNEKELTGCIIEGVKELQYCGMLRCIQRQAVKGRCNLRQV